MGKRILVIEPSPTLRAILGMYFEREQQQFVQFENYEAAAQALPCFRSEPPDLALVALHIHQPESFRVTELLRQQYAQMILIVMIAQEDSSQSTVRHLVQRTQAIALPKPFSIQDVLNLLAAAAQVASTAPRGIGIEREKRA
ncbi:MAG: response regulator [Ktedonobacteraceae bacterium]|nr:response regulator [Ktedonobacteraceae bacterium]